MTLPLPSLTSLIAEAHSLGLVLLGLQQESFKWGKDARRPVEIPWIAKLQSHHGSASRHLYVTAKGPTADHALSRALERYHEELKLELAHRARLAAEAPAHAPALAPDLQTEVDDLSQYL